MLGGMAGMEPTPSKSVCDWTLVNYAKGVVFNIIIQLKCVVWNKKNSADMFKLFKKFIFLSLEYSHKFKLKFISNENRNCGPYFNVEL